MLKATLALVTLSAPLAALAWGNNDIWQTKELALETAGVSTFEANTGAGDLEILGKDNLDEIMVVAKFGGKELDESDYVFTLERNGSTARLITSVDSSGSKNTYIDVKVLVPSSLLLEVNDRSGDLSVKDIDADVRIDDRSGDVYVSDINGDLKIEDNSGDVDIKNVTGSLSVEDKSGDINIRRVSGIVDIEDKSGDIEVEDIEANVTIDDSSGDIDIANIKGLVKVVDSGGDVDVVNAYDFEIDKRGGGDVESRSIGAK